MPQSSRGHVTLVPPQQLLLSDIDPPSQRTPCGAYMVSYPTEQQY